jgi:hypothetical protein
MQVIIILILIIYFLKHITICAQCFYNRKIVHTNRNTHTHMLMIK